jgi:hypothetical protein
MANITDKKSLEIIQKSTDLYKGKNNTTHLRRNFSHFLLDFGIVEQVVGFVIAITAVDLIKSISKNVINESLHITDEVQTNLVSLILIIIFAYIFVKYIYYEIVYTDDVAKENILKKAINEKKVEAVKEKIEHVPRLKHILTKEANHVDTVNIVANDTKKAK